MRITLMRWVIVILVLLVLGLWFFPTEMKGFVTGAATAIKTSLTGLF